MKRLIIHIIRFYQRNISPYKGFRCPYCPTCSRYAIDAYTRHGVIKGTILTTWRLVRCNPFSHGGYDPVPEHFWRKDQIV